MRKILNRMATLSALMVLVAIVISGCVITDMNHPTTVVDGQTFDVTFSTTVNDDFDYPPIYFIIGVMMPDNFDWVTGSWDLVGGGNGQMVETDEATLGTDFANTYNTHPVPAGYSWRVFRTSDAFDPTGSTTDYVTDYVYRFRAHLVKDQAYTMSYASGWVYADMSAYALGNEEDQSWDNPINCTTAVESMSLGNIKAEFK